MALQEFGLVGPTYQARSVVADGERCINFIPEQVSTQNGKAQYILGSVPPLWKFPNSQTALAATEVFVENKSVWDITNSKLRTFLVTYNPPANKLTVYEMTNQGASLIMFGSVLLYPYNKCNVWGCWLASNGTSLICAVTYVTTNTFGKFLTGLYSFSFANSANGVTNYLNSITSWNNTLGVAPNYIQATGLDFLDSYFILSTLSGFYVSAPGDPLTWSALNFATENDEPDGILGLKQHQRLLWFFGTTRIETYYDAGNADFPMQRVPNGVIEVGCLSGATICRVDNSLFWLGSDEHGTIAVFRTNGYQAVRVSNHAIESILALYASSIGADPNYLPESTGTSLANLGFAYTNAYNHTARAFTYTEQGHQFYVLNFPSPVPAAVQSSYASFTTPPPTTLVYDCATQLWHERQYSADGGVTTARDLPQLYSYSAAGHLVTAYNSNQLYYLGWNMPRAGNISEGSRLPSFCSRTTPHLTKSNQYTYYSRFLADYDFPDVNGYSIAQILNQATQVAEASTLTLQWSNDGGETWNAGVPLTIGATNYSATLSTRYARALWRRLGKGRDRVFRLTYAGWARRFVLINAFLEAEQGTS